MSGASRLLFVSPALMSGEFSLAPSRPLCRCSNRRRSSSSWTLPQTAAAGKSSPLTPRPRGCGDGHPPRPGSADCGYRPRDDRASRSRLPLMPPHMRRTAIDRIRSKSGSHRTLRRREQDSNHRSPVTRPIFQCRLWLVPRQPKSRSERENRHTKRRALPPRNRWFESCSLHRRVCEPRSLSAGWIYW
jgi:hypothetical protein